MTLGLDDLSLTPAALEELTHADERLVAAWLNAASLATGLRSPAGFVLAGVRSGQPPTVQDDAHKAQQVRLAESYVRTAGLYLPTEPELLDDLFGPHGRLKHWADDEPLQQRFVELWREQRPRGQQAEQEQQDRATRWRQAHDRALEPDDQDWT